MRSVDEVASRFRELNGRAPDTIWSAPGRVNLIGEHTDYNGGFVLPFAIDSYVHVAAAARSDGRIVARSVQAPDDVGTARVRQLAPGAGRGRWVAYPFGVAWLLAGGAEAGGVDLLVDGQLPLGGGLSSSAALECAVAGALDELYGLGIPPMTLALACQEAEHQFPGVPCGVMDQLAVMLCEERHALFIDTRDLETKQVPLDPAATDAVFLLIDTGIRHDLASSAYAERRRTCEEAAAALGVAALRDVGVHELPDALAALDDHEARRRVRHVVTENERVLEALELLEQGQLRKVGPLLTASHASLRDDYEVSCAELDLTAAAAEAAGALGARMIGGGFGGSVLALADAADAERITDVVSGAYAAENLPPPNVRLVHPARGAARATGVGAGRIP